MNEPIGLPADEQAHYDEARERNLEADHPPRPELSEVERAHIRLLAHQASHIVREAPELLEWLEDRAWLADMPPRAMKGYLGCLRQIRTCANWEVDDGRSEPDAGE